MLEDLFRADRRNVELGFYLAETHFSAGDLERASQYFKRILAADPDHFESLVYSGISASEEGDAPTAEGLLKHAIDRKPEAFLPQSPLPRRGTRRRRKAS
jgi:tetratricopeptide (TPR) repeat protein